jgi:hypothetical protein
MAAMSEFGPKAVFSILLVFCIYGILLEYLFYERDICRPSEAHRRYLYRSISGGNPPSLWQTLLIPKWVATVATWDGLLGAAEVQKYVALENMREKILPSGSVFFPQCNWCYLPYLGA